MATFVLRWPYPVAMSNVFLVDPFLPISTNFLIAFLAYFSNEAGFQRSFCSCALTLTEPSETQRKYNPLSTLPPKNKNPFQT